MKYKIIVIITALILGSYSSICQDWHHVSTPGLNLKIADAFTSFTYLNSAGGSHGIKYDLMKSTDGSYTYSIIKTKSGDFGCYSIDNLFLIDANTLFFAENCQGITTIYKSIDGGVNWTNTGMGGSFSISMYFLRENFGYYSFYPGPPNDSYFLRNGEVVFTTTKYVFGNYPHNGQRTEIYFKNDSTGLIMCRDSSERAVIIRTDNYGVEWIPRLITVYASYNDMHFINDSVGFVVGSAGFIRKTTDFGDNWEIKGSVSSELFSIDFSEDGNGYAVGAEGLILKSSDEGNSWTEVEFPHSRDLVYVKSLNNDLAYVLDTLGLLYSNKDASAIVDQSEPSVKAYPNPVANKLILAIDDNVSLEGIVIYDLMGRVILKTDKREIDLSHLEIGVYVLEARTTKGVVTKRIIKK